MSELSKIVEFRKGPHRARPMNKNGAEIHELGLLPHHSRLTPTQLLTSLSRDTAGDYDSALVFLRRQEPCPCGCGEETEVVAVYTAGPMHNERVNWVADKLKMWALGMEIGEYDDG